MLNFVIVQGGRSARWDNHFRKICFALIKLNKRFWWASIPRGRQECMGYLEDKFEHDPGGIDYVFPRADAEIGQKGAFCKGLYKTQYVGGNFS
jgi:hypothetical protein